MNRFAPMIPVIVILAFMAGLAACNDQEEFDEDADRALMAGMEAEIDEFIGEPTCQDSGDCRVIAFGAKPCGGPWSYKVFSASSVDTTELFTMVSDYNKFNASLNERYGWMSDCMMVMSPGVECLEGRCVAIEPAKETAVE